LGTAVVIARLQRYTLIITRTSKAIAIVVVLVGWPPRLSW